MIVDAHAHFGPGLEADHPMGPVLRALTASELIKLLDAAEIERAVVFAPSWQGGSDGQDFVDPNYERANEAIAEGMRHAPDRLVGLARVNPKFGSKAERELQRCFDDYGMRGLHLNTAAEGFTALHTSMLAPLLEQCQAHQAAVSVHTSFYPAQAYPWSAAIEAFPSVPFVLAHAGYRQWADALIVAERHANVYLETSLQLPVTVRRLIEKLGAGRVLFGSNVPYAFPDIELRALRDLRLTDDEFEKVAGKNAANLFAPVAAASRT